MKIKFEFLTGVLKGKVKEIDKVKVTFGRDQHNLIMLNYDNISGDHAVFEKKQGEWWVVDRSKNGTILNGQKISDRENLYINDVVRMGNIEVKVIEGPDIRPEPKPDANEEKGAEKSKDKKSDDDIKLKPQVEKKDVKLKPEAGKKDVLLKPEVEKKDVKLKPEAEGEHSEEKKKAAVILRKKRLRRLRRSKIQFWGIIAVALVFLVYIIDKSLPVLMKQLEANQAKTQPQQQPPPKITRAPQPSFMTKRIKTEVITQTLPTESTVYIQSYPSGAELELDGIPVGITPYSLNNLKSGPHSITLYKEGYKVREFTFEHPRNSVQIHSLEQVDNSAVITSSPPGAVVTIGGQKKGHTPLLLTDLKEGATKVKVSSLGFETQLSYLNILPSWKRDHLHVELKSTSGSVSIITRPPGCKVFLDGDPVGITDGVFGDLTSKPLILKNILPGTYKLKITSGDQSEVSESEIIVKGGEQVEKGTALKLVNAMLTTTDGEEVYGIVIKQTDLEVTFAYRKKGEQVFEEWQQAVFKKIDIERIDPSSLQKMLGFTDGIKLLADNFKDLQPSIHDENDDTDFEAILEEAEDLGEMTAAALITESKTLDLIAMATKYRHKKVTVSGKVSMIREGESVFSIVFDDKIECYIEKDEELRVTLAAMKGKDVKITGLCLGMGGLDRVVIVEAAFNE